MFELAVALEEASSGGATVSPVAVGVVVFGFLMILLFAMLAFGKGRDHT